VPGLELNQQMPFFKIDVQAVNFPLFDPNSALTGLSDQSII
jgi:hypothetical protein